MDLVLVYKLRNLVIIQSPEAMPKVNVKVINTNNEIIYEDSIENIKFKCVTLKQGDIAHQVLLTAGSRTYSKFFYPSNGSNQKNIKALSNMLITN